MFQLLTIMRSMRILWSATGQNSSRTKCYRRRNPMDNATDRCFVFSVVQAAHRC